MTRGRSTRTRRWWLAACLLAPATVARAETLYVRSADADLKASADAAAAVVATLPRGTALEVVGRTGSWLEVRAGGKNGWVHKLKAGSEPPASGGGALAALGGGGRGDYVKEAESGRGARGLSPSAEAYAKGRGATQAAIETVERMEQIQVDKREVERFLREGKLGEWSE